MAIKAWQGLNAFSEAYEVVKVVKVVGNDMRTYRIEVIEANDNPSLRFTFDVYRELKMKVSPSYAGDGGPAREVTALVIDDIPDAPAETADEALQNALRSLAETVRQRGRA